MANSARYWRINHLSVGSTLGEQGETNTADIRFPELYFYALSTDTVPLSGTYTLEPDRTSSWSFVGSDPTSVLTDGVLSTISYVAHVDSGFNIGVTFDAGSSTTVGKIRISSLDHRSRFADTPIRWVLEASENGTDWFDTGVLTADGTAWTRAETRDYTVSPSWAAGSMKVITQRASVVSEPPSPDVLAVQTVRASVVSEPPSSENLVVNTLRASVVIDEMSQGGLGQGNNTYSPEFIQDTTNYVKFEPNTNNKKLLFKAETSGVHTIIALRPNLLDFFESTQTLTADTWEQIRVPHFNQLFIHPNPVSADTIDGVKSGMLERATGTGIDIDAGTENSVPGGLQDPLLV